MEGQQNIPQQPIPPYYYDEDTISLSDILLVLAKQLKLLIITPLVFGVITAFYVFFMVGPTYVSSAKIMSSSGGSSTSQLQGLAAQFGVTVPGGSEGAQWVYPEIIKSRTLARSLLDRKF
ncbi:MAG: Wzz/FepE/Etk N-terminal domain-containing protein, partial [Candidatus Neomarinimicrobiota bacterium]|nr:Wzz/FepE/Etk N-terminal domain-containing protein [Candidatus Neomarinimicrobiota bacterium]